MCGRGGINAYNSPCANAYQDMFAVTVFSGKGLINIDAFYECLNSSLPIERILSHDILEGSYLRCGLCTDVELLDGCPSSIGRFQQPPKPLDKGRFSKSSVAAALYNGGRRERKKQHLLFKQNLSVRQCNKGTQFLHLPCNNYTVGLCSPAIYVFCFGHFGGYFKGTI